MPLCLIPPKINNSSIYNKIVVCLFNGGAGAKALSVRAESIIRDNNKRREWFKKDIIKKIYSIDY